MGMSEFYGSRDEVFLATKFGLLRSADPAFRGVCGRPDYVRSSCEGSLRSMAGLPDHDYRRATPRFQDENFRKNLALLAPIDSGSRKKGARRINSPTSYPRAG
jgi:aryl-alcohol dehydrogenase-like predicted oxidoreductase